MVTDRFMEPTDAWIWYLEQDPLLRFTVTAVTVLDRAPDWDRLVDRFEKATRVAPHFRDRVVSTPFRLAPPRWVSDQDFDLGYHLRRVRAPAPGTLDSVLEIARTTAMAGLDRSRPLWEATLVEGVDGDGAALIIKAHHSLTDGVGGMQLALVLFDLEPDAEPGDWPEAPTPERLTSAELARQAVVHHARRAAHLGARTAGTALPTLGRLARDPVATTRGWLRSGGSIARMVRPVGETLSPVMADRGLSWRFRVLDVPFAELRGAAKTTGTTLNDAFLAGITGGMRRYHEQLGHPVAELRVSMPISTRKAGDPVGGNRVAIVRYPVPVDIVDPQVRLHALHDAAAQARNEPAVPHTDAILEVVSPVTPLAVRAMAVHMDFGASNVPGPAFPVHLAGAEALRFYPFGPTGGSAVNITLLSYRGTCCIGVNMDTAAITDGDRFLHCLTEGFAEVLAVSDGEQQVTPARGRA
ncbi:wax ester/triacylglycerol synthase family O-acyltransferase [Acidimicrobiia bacterium EGI L10123]|uniref:wax ester/triacylglycerol synthase family O-acyltransferase n=1 Tax=Salinilacustrithrix flava TaxID=2957203 RepID=UPI003D7C30DA|nr:wax ester/triacylglycerol synthase family O-acyltransferase [Acidimicrobiia bacterium EGI L10123]